MMTYSVVVRFDARENASEKIVGICIEREREREREKTQ